MIGKTVSHYRITGKLGAGGMGEVFLVEDTQLERQAAIKFLPAEMAADPERRQRFLREAKAASALNHPHVCVVYEVGETEAGLPFIVMELVAGQSLDKAILGGPLEITRVVEIAVQVADALDAAHASRIVHRDIKPANINLAARGHVKVLDFGLAKRLPQTGSGGLETTEDFQQTHIGQVLGTPSYMSPEQALAKEMDHRTDLFSLGVVLYELSTGQLPFTGSSFAEVVNKIVHAQPTAIARLNYDVPPELERITLKCLQKSPDRRYQSARELMIDLQNLKRAMEEGLGSIDATESFMAANRFDAAVVTSPPSMAELKASDIFISCAQLDDQPLTEGREGWVSQFQRNLKVRLEQLAGETVKLTSFPMQPGESSVDERVFQQLPDVKTMVSVLSPPFARSKGCCRGIEAFCQQTQRSGKFYVKDRPRLFKVMKTPIDEGDLPPQIDEVLRRLIGFEFYERDPETGRFREFDETFGEQARQRYYEKVYDLAYEIAQVLKYQRDATTENATAAASGKRIYLSETTSDLQDEYDRLRRELLEQGHVVLPDRPLPLVAGDFQAAVRAYLAQCNLAIHLIGRRYGLVPEDMNQSVVVVQNSLAAEQSRHSKLERLIWMPRNLSPQDERQAAFVRQLREDPEAQRGADVVEDTLENLKEIIEDRWRQAEASPPTPLSGGDGSVNVARVYLICDQRDESAVESLEDFFYEQGIEVSLPDFGEDESSVGQFHWQQLQDCDAVLVYYGAGSKAWVDIKLRDLIKAVGYREGRPIAHQTVLVAPPLDRRKERFRTLSAEIIRQADEAFDAQLLAAFVDQIKHGKQASA
jgi:serine/threonine protein kinase